MCGICYPILARKDARQREMDWVEKVPYKRPLEEEKISRHTEATSWVETLQRMLGRILMRVLDA